MTPYRTLVAAAALCLLLLTVSQGPARAQSPAPSPAHTPVPSTWGGDQPFSVIDLFRRQFNGVVTKNWFQREGAPDVPPIKKGVYVAAGVKWYLEDCPDGPALFMLKGAGSKFDCAELTSVTLNTGKGYENVGIKAAGIHFLHTLNPGPGLKLATEKPPVVFSYVVHYVDGTTEKIPVHWGVEVGDWFPPAGPVADLPQAQAIEFLPPGGEPERRAVLYAMYWANPKPDVAMVTFDIVAATNREGADLGAPAVMALTVPKGAPAQPKP